jgi:uncharacterized protein
MIFEWDEDKRFENIEKHGFDFIDAQEMFKAPMLIVPDTRFDYNEERWIGIGLVRNTVAVIAYTERGEDETTIRIISMRKAFKNERKEYEKRIKN